MSKRVTGILAPCSQVFLHCAAPTTLLPAHARSTFCPVRPMLEAGGCANTTEPRDSHQPHHLSLSKPARNPQHFSVSVIRRRVRLSGHPAMRRALVPRYHEPLYRIILVKQTTEPSAGSIIVRQFQPRDEPQVHALLTEGLVYGRESFTLLCSIIH